MLPHSFRLALRHFTRKRIYSSIIVLSLTVGFACTCLLVSFLIGEESVDSFHSKKDRLFELASDDPFGDSGRLNYTTERIGDYMMMYPEVENICQLTVIPGAEAKIDDNITPMNTIGVDTSFFTLFDFPIIAGSKEIMSDGIIITSAKANQLFGTADVLGRTINLRTADSAKLVSITGILGTPKEKSHLRFDAVVGHSVIEPFQDGFRGGVNYLLMRDGASAPLLASKVNGDTLRPTLMGAGQLSYYFEPIQEAYTSTWNRQQFMQTRSETFIRVGWIVCGLILFMASFNFVNLFLLSIQERKKEAGIQKTLGISLWQTMRGATVEAGVYIGISFMLSLIVAYTLVPVFNNALKAEMEFGYLSNFKVLAIIVSLVVALTILVIILTTIKNQKTLPVSMMRNVSAKVKFSKLFFTLQFFVSIMLCVCSIAIIQQMKFLETAPIGFNKNIVLINSPREGSINRLSDLKSKILEIPEVERVAQSSGNPISGNSVMVQEDENGSRVNIYLFQGDNDLIETLDLKLVEGRLDFRTPNDRIVNETFLKSFNIKDPIGARVPGAPLEARIIGVVKDFTCSSFKNAIPAAVISHEDNTKNLLVSYGQSDIDILLPKLRAAWNTIFPHESFEFRTIQQDLMNKYSEENLFYKVVLAASVTSMIISCFGLFALSWAVIRSRAKEMGIRKVLGASVANILVLLTATFAKRLLVAFVLAAPVGYYLMTLWLERFVYKAPIDSRVFILAGIALATIAVVTLGFQTLKASMSSPLDEIRE
jgi:putative ABC transport system permease protein